MDKSEPESRFTGGFVVEDDPKFKRYLLGELFWELEQHQPIPAMFAGVSRDEVEVLMYRGYDDLRVRIACAVYDIVLSWRKSVPPSIKRL